MHSTELTSTPVKRLVRAYACEPRIYLNNNNNNTAPSTRISCVYFHSAFAFVSTAAIPSRLPNSWKQKPVLIMHFTRYTHCTGDYTLVRTKTLHVVTTIVLEYSTLLLRHSRKQVKVCNNNRLHLRI